MSIICFILGTKNLFVAESWDNPMNRKLAFDPKFYILKIKFQKFISATYFILILQMFTIIGPDVTVQTTYRLES